MTAAEEFLLELQREVCGTYLHSQSHQGTPIPELVRKRIEKSYELSKEWPADLSQQSAEGSNQERMQQDLAQAERLLNDPTFRNPQQPLIFAFQQAVDQFHEIMTKAGSALPRIPTVGTLPIGEMNAWTMAVPDTDDEYVIVFHSGLGLLLNRMLKIVLTISAATDRDKYDAIDHAAPSWRQSHETLVLEALPRVAEYEQHFVHTLQAYLILGDPNIAPPIYLAKTLDVLRAPILHYAEMFVAGHEYAHIALGHVQPDRRKRLAVGTREVEAFDWKHADEFAADLIGIAITSAHSAGEYLENVRSLHFMNICGADLFFSCARLVEQCLADITGVNLVPRSRSHPPIEDRRLRIRELLNQITGELDANLYGDEWRIILDLLYRRNRDAIRRPFEQGVQLSPIWSPLIKPVQD